MSNKDNKKATSERENNTVKNNRSKWLVNIPYILRYALSTILVLFSLQMLNNEKTNDDAIATMLLGTGLTPFGIVLTGQNKPKQ